MPPAVCMDDRPKTDEGPMRLSLAGSASNRDEDDDPGYMLQRAREAQGLSLEDMSRLTKISVTKLRALEDNDFDVLPSDVYVRGFLRAYAREVELDPEQTVQKYFARLQADQELVSVTMPSHVVSPTHVPATLHAVAHDNGNHASDFASQPKRFQWLVLVLAMLGFGGYLAYTRTQSPAQLEPSVAAAPVATDAAQAGGAGGVDQVAHAANAANLPTPPVLQFEFHPQGPCWLSANADGTRVMSKLLQPGERQTFEVRDELVLRVGDPGAVTFSINGQTGRALGRAGEPVNVRITKDNYREFLTSAS